MQSATLFTADAHPLIRGYYLDTSCVVQAPETRACENDSHGITHADGSLQNCGWTPLRAAGRPEGVRINIETYLWALTREKGTTGNLTLPHAMRLS